MTQTTHARLPPHEWPIKLSARCQGTVQDGLLRVSKRPGFEHFSPVLVEVTTRF